MKIEPGPGLQSWWLSFLANPCRLSSPAPPQPSLPRNRVVKKKYDLKTHCPTWFEAGEVGASEREEYGMVLASLSEEGSISPASSLSSLSRSIGTGLASPTRSIGGGLASPAQGSVGSGGGKHRPRTHGGERRRRGEGESASGGGSPHQVNPVIPVTPNPKSQPPKTEAPSL